MNMTKPMPAIFFGHGNPMNALQTNVWTRAWAALGNSVPKPTSIICISAHWYLSATLVTAQELPRTIHDFGGFPRELYEIKYPARGNPELAKRVKDLLAPVSVELDTRWGLDHGTWSVLGHVFPEADVPVIQLSIDDTQPAQFHYETAKRLSSLRDEGVLIIGSGNIVHNLHAYAWGRQQVEPLDYETLGRDAILSIPTPDHYLPLLYVIAQMREGESIRFPVEGFDGGSVSMLTVQIG
jgi:4,5-DOPA dioxygenase extradiol